MHRYNFNCNNYIARNVCPQKCYAYSINPIGVTGPTGPTGATGPTGSTGPTGPTGLFLSSYIEASGNAQLVGTGNNIAFDIDPDSLDIAGNNIDVDPSGTVFTIRQAGLYHVEWSLNLQSGTQPTIICLLENQEYSSAMSNVSSSGNYSSGALINVTDADIPFTVSLHNFGEPISITEPDGYNGTAASIRILKFADGPSA